jgi:RHS repeat-associated protein
MIMPGRKFSAGGGYRYGFNGKELDKEVAGTTTYDYGFRIYSPALGRFLGVDPLTQSYPWYTPYQFAGNKPIWATDVDGLEENTT